MSRHAVSFDESHEGIEASINLHAPRCALSRYEPRRAPRVNVTGRIHVVNPRTHTGMTAPCRVSRIGNAR